MFQRKSQETVKIKRHTTIIRKVEAKIIQNKKVDEGTIRIFGQNVFWTSFFKRKHEHQNSPYVSAFINLLFEDIQQFYSQDYKEMPFQDQTIYSEVLNILQEIKLQNILIAIKNMLQCEICSQQSNETIKTILKQYQSFLRCICSYEQRNFNNFEVYSLYYDIMHQIYTSYVMVKKNQLVWNKIQQKTFRNHHNQAYFTYFEGNKLGQCQVRLILSIILIKIANISQQSEIRKNVDMFLKIHNQNNQNGNLSRFVVSIIAKKQLHTILGQYFRDNITVKLVNILKCSNYSYEIKHQLVSGLTIQHKKSKSNCEQIDNKQQYFTDKKDSNKIVIQFSHTDRLQQSSEHKQIVPPQQQQMVKLSFEQQIQKAFASAQSNLPDSVVQDSLLFLSNLKIDGGIKCKSQRVNILKRLFNLSLFHASLAKSCIENSLRLLPVSQLVEIVNQMLPLCSDLSRQAYRLNLKQILNKYVGVAKQIRIPL